MLDRVVSDLLGQAVFVGLQEFFYLAKAYFFLVELRLKIVSLGELVCHVILHVGNLLLRLLHLLVDPSSKVLNLFEVILHLVLLNSEPGSGGLSVLQLPLLEL